MTSQGPTKAVGRIRQGRRAAKQLRLRLSFSVHLWVVNDHSYPTASSICHDSNNLADPSTGFSDTLGFQRGLPSISESLLGWETMGEARIPAFCPLSLNPSFIHAHTPWNVRNKPNNIWDSPFSGIWVLLPFQNCISSFWFTQSSATLACFPSSRWNFEAQSSNIRCGSSERKNMMCHEGMKIACKESKVGAIFLRHWTVHKRRRFVWCDLQTLRGQKGLNRQEGRADKLHAWMG